MFLLLVRLLLQTVFFDWIDDKVESVPLLEESISMTYLQNEEWTGEGASAGILHNTVITNLYDK